MEFKFNWQHLNFISLKMISLALGAIELALCFAMMLMTMKLSINHDFMILQALYYTAGLALLACLFMMAGNFLENQWFMVPHVAIESALVLVYPLFGLLLLNLYLDDDLRISLVPIVGLLSVIPAFSGLSWTVSYHRFHKVNAEQSAVIDEENSDSIEMA